jgi:hypothetical protein
VFAVRRWVRTGKNDAVLKSHSNFDGPILLSKMKYRMGLIRDRKKESVRYGTDCTSTVQACEVRKDVSMVGP